MRFRRFPCNWTCRDGQPRHSFRARTIRPNDLNGLLVSAESCVFSCQDHDCFGKNQIVHVDRVSKYEEISGLFGREIFDNMHRSCRIHSHRRRWNRNHIKKLWNQTTFHSPYCDFKALGHETSLKASSLRNQKCIDIESTDVKPRFWPL